MHIAHWLRTEGDSRMHLGIESSSRMRLSLVDGYIDIRYASAMQSMD
jgi:hypothetical protein